ncbi:MAG: ATP-binding protein [Bryobacteraceae bacterium]
MQAAVTTARVIAPERVTGPAGGAVSKTHAELIRENAELMRENAELARENGELGRDNAELEQFVWSASHDLKEPLRMVSNWLDLLEQRHGQQLPEEGQEYLGIARTGAARMQNLIDDLLGFARLGARAFAPECVNSEIAVTAALANLDPAIRESGAEIECSVLPDLMADPGLLTQVFQNLIGNAVKFRGADAPRVRISAERNGEGWVFAVGDNGIGIPVEYHSRIFQVFERLHSADEYPGTGIGLTIVQRAIEKHGGRIWVESKEGEGATFLFLVPDRRSA